MLIILTLISIHDIERYIVSIIMHRTLHNHIDQSLLTTGSIEQKYLDILKLDIVKYEIYESIEEIILQYLVDSNIIQCLTGVDSYLQERSNMYEDKIHETREDILEDIYFFDFFKPIYYTMLGNLIDKYGFYGYLEVANSGPSGTVQVPRYGDILVGMECEEKLETYIGKVCVRDNTPYKLNVHCIEKKNDDSPSGKIQSYNFNTKTISSYTKSTPLFLMKIAYTPIEVKTKPNTDIIFYYINCDSYLHDKYLKVAFNVSDVYNDIEYRNGQCLYL